MVNLTLLRYYLQRYCLQDIADVSGVSYACLWNIRHGKTAMPQHRTLVKLLPVLGLELNISHV